MRINGIKFLEHKNIENGSKKQSTQNSHHVKTQINTLNKI